MSHMNPGATVIGLIFKDGVMLAADKRFTYGVFITAKNEKKTFKISDKTGSPCAGLVTYMQELMKELTSLIKLKEIRSGKKTNVNAIAKLTSVVMYNRKIMPYLTQIAIGGFSKKPELYSLDPLGSVLPDDYVSLGTGAEIAIGVLELNYKKNMEKNDAKQLIQRSLKAAMQRDTGSGDGIDLTIITKDEYTEETESFE